MAVDREFPQGLPFEVYKPAELRVPFLFNSPHSGRFYPIKFREMSCLNDFDIRLSEDRFVDLLFQDVVPLGAALMTAWFPRAYLDVNREAFELDASMFEDSLPDFVPVPSARVSAGLGSVPRVVAQGKAIYAHKIPVREALERISQIYKPYHIRLAHEIAAIQDIFGYSVLIDCHSMPGQLRYFGGEVQPDIILGDLHGRSCVSALTEKAAELLSAMGYHVAHNQPYAGGYITAHYGRPLKNGHVLQIEINRDLYLDPLTLEPTDNFHRLRQDLACFAQDIMAIPDAYFMLRRDAAE